MFVILGIVILISSFVIALISLIKEQRKLGENQHETSESPPEYLTEGVAHSELPESAKLGDEVTSRDITIETLQNKIDALRERNVQEGDVQKSAKVRDEREGMGGQELIGKTAIEDQELKFPWDQNVDYELDARPQILAPSSLSSDTSIKAEAGRNFGQKSRPKSLMSGGGEFSVSDLVNKNNGN